MIAICLRPACIAALAVLGMLSPTLSGVVEFKCYTEHDCPITRLDPVSVTSTGVVTTPNSILIDNQHRVTIDPISTPDRKRNTPLVLIAVSTEYDQFCQPDGHTKEVPAKPDVDVGDSPTPTKCGTVFQVAVRYWITLSYTTKDGKVVNTPPLNYPIPPNQQQKPEPTATKCNGFTPEHSCGTHP